MMIFDSDVKFKLLNVFNSVYQVQLNITHKVKTPMALYLDYSEKKLKLIYVPG